MLQNVLCAIDGSTVSETVIRTGAELARLAGGKLTVLTVTTVDSQSAARTAYWDSQVLSAAEAQLRAEMRVAERVVAASGFEGAAFVVASGRDVARAVADYAEAHGHDHVVVGAHARGRVARALLGSVSAAICAVAPCPVTIVR